MTKFIHILQIVNVDPNNLAQRSNNFFLDPCQLMCALDESGGLKEVKDIARRVVVALVTVPH